MAAEVCIVMLIGVARKGWLTKGDVMNCLPLGKIEKPLAAKAKGIKK